MNRVRGRLVFALAAVTACSCVVAQTQTPMRTVMPGTTLSSTLLGRGTPPVASGRSLEVFASSAMYLTNTEGATVHRVDGRAQVLAEVNQGGLPPDPVKAMAIAQERIRIMGPEFQRRMREDLRTTEKVVVYGIQRVPAVVVDGKRIVYGVTDVRKAVEIAAAGGGDPMQMRMIPGNPELVRK